MNIFIFVSREARKLCCQSPWEHMKASSIRKELVYSEQNGCDIEGHGNIACIGNSIKSKPVVFPQFLGGIMGDKVGVQSRI